VEILAAITVAKAINVLYAALGLGLVIFIHELGHFAVAKWCGVKVERFSIGFGPILWKVTRGETEYALSVIPFGGYVKMLGQDDADPAQMADTTVAKDPRSYTAKSVPQRIAIISAGVINNMVSAVIFFIIAFMLGVKYQPAVVGGVAPGMPAWEAGLRQGDKITRIGSREDPKLSFTDVRLAVALSRADEQIEIMGLRNGKPFTTWVKPVVIDKQLVPTIFVEAEQGLTLPDKEEDDDNFSLTSPGLAAALASPPFQPGDELKQLDGVALDDFADLARELANRRDKTVEFGVRRKGAAKDAPLTQISVGPNHFRTLGLRMAIGQIKAIQRGSPADGKLRAGDTITHILEPEQRVIGVDLDPMRLPDYFAGLAGQEVKVRYKREVPGGNPTVDEAIFTPEARAGWSERPSLDEDCPLSIPSIGVAVHVLHHVVDVEKDSPAEKAGIRKDDNIVKIEYVLPKDAKGDDSTKASIEIPFKDDQRNWPLAFWLMQMYPQRTIKLTVKSQGADQETTAELVPNPDPDWYMPMRGLRMQVRSDERKAENIGEAISLGFRRTRDSVIEMWFTVHGLFSQRISPKALGGPIRIFDTAMYFSKQGLPNLILFLGILSVSLAVLNFLPIPVLDGGHFAFLCWEGIRGKPPSERVVVAATYVGLAFVLSLMVWVLYMDISSFFISK